MTLDFAYLLGVTGLATARWVLLAAAAAAHHRRHRSVRRRDPLSGTVQTLGARAPGPPTMPVSQVPVDVLIPAFNEEAVIEGTIRSLLRCEGVALNLWVIDDGSTDDTVTRVRMLAATHPQVRLVQSPANEGKAAALNRGLAAGSSPFVLCVDADTVVAPSTPAQLVASLLPRDDLAAVCANVQVGNTHRLLPRLQAMEYATAQHLERRAQDTLHCITTLPGACTLFRRAPLEQVGGWNGRTLTEDTDLSLELLQAGHTAAFLPTADAWTEAPLTLGQLFRQRRRWLSGYHQVLRHHLSATFGHGVLSWFGLPNLWWVHVWGFLLPVGALMVGSHAAAAWWKLFWPLVWGLFAADLFVGVLAWRFDGRPWRDLWLLPLQRLLWIPLLYAVFVVVVAGHITGGFHRWVKLERSGELSRHHAGGGEGALR